jgi:PAS domain S-box-containing protein
VPGSRKVNRRGEGRSLGSILTIRFFALSLAALAVAGCLQVFFNVRLRNTSVASMQQLVAAEAEMAVSGFVKEKLSALSSVLWVSAPHALNPAEQTGLLSGLLGRDPSVRRIFLMDTRDRVTALVSRRSTTEVEEGDHLRWQEASRDVQRAAAALSQVYFDKSSSEPLILIALPMKDILGAPRGTLLEEVNLKFLWDLVSKLAVGRTGYAYVVDREGNLIAFGDAARVLARENLAAMAPVSAFINRTSLDRSMFRGYRGLMGTRVVGTYLSMGLPDWAVVVEMPWREAYGETIREVSLIACIYILMAGLAGGAGLASARRLAAPIERLMGTASRIASGERGLQADVEGPREVAALSLAFNSMTAQLRESLEQADRYFTMAIDLLCIADTEGRFRRLNKEWETALGYSIQELEGKSFMDFVHPEDRESTQAELGRLRGETEVFNFVNRYRHKDGSYRWIEWRSAPYGKLIYAVARDITKRKQDEDEIRRLNESLEERVALRTAQLETANKDLETFAYSVAHDLRAPLRAISGYARIMSEEHGTSINDEGKRILSVVEKEALRMAQMIASLLDLARIGRASLARAPVDMTDLARSCFEKVAEPQVRASIELHIGALPAVAADASLIGQVWMNLLSNAIKFTSRKQKAVIRVDGTVQGDELIYRVSDNGAGFDMRYINRLFGVFQRLHAPSEFEGNGIGLALVQRIIAIHGGRVWAEGAVEKGATFSFSLPRTAG